jgi:hypothetical protein
MEVMSLVQLATHMTVSRRKGLAFSGFMEVEPKALAYLKDPGFVRGDLGGVGKGVGTIAVCGNEDAARDVVGSDGLVDCGFEVCHWSSFRCSACS